MRTLNQKTTIDITAGDFAKRARKLYRVGRQKDVRCGCDAWFIFDQGNIYECDGPFPITIKL